ncbi:hypothetical protein CDD83_3362 [Cordyceps sp. RAO-2017]|nr:hypothetical protein CDD83_3362 [Cordyceps sp. RAO-2017]
MTSHRRGPWSNTEDNYLMQLVHAHGPLNWVRIAQTLGSRTPKQCRERYHQNLKPTLNHEPITPEEGQQIEHLVHEIGKRWAEIARRLHGRSDNAVKNWWNGSQNRRKRLDRRRAVVHTAGAPSPAHMHSPVDTPGPAQAYTQNVFDDDRCPRVAPLPMVSPGGLPRPHSTGCPSSPASETPFFHRHNSWTELPLPSPCSSEPAESDAGSTYTTSPAGSTRALDRISNELPPLRSLQPVASGRGRLPSLRLVAPKTGYDDLQPRLSQAYAPAQLPTAPSSPVSNQEEQKQKHYQYDTGPETPSQDRDARMNLATLLI